MPKTSSSLPKTQVKPDPVLEKRTRRTYKGTSKNRLNYEIISF